MNQLAVRQNNSVVLDDKDKAVIVKAAMSGDFSKLNDAEKAHYLLSTCANLGLNPALAAQYFEYIPFQGKVALYAKKGLAEALRDARNVRCEVLSTQLDKDLLLYSVKVRASLGTRSEESLAFRDVSGLKGKDLANAFMKTETSAKRRATLALCGLGFTEKPEDALGEDYDDLSRKTPVMQPELPAEEEPWNHEPPVKLISEMQVKRFHAIKNSYSWSNEQAKTLLAEYGIDSSKNIPSSKYEEICAILEQESPAKYTKDEPGQVKLDGSIVE